MATIQTINPGDLITSSRSDINTNFANLNSDKIETSAIDTDTALTANSDSKIPSQKAVKAYVDAGGNPNASTTQSGIVEEATQAELTAGTTSGATGARLFLNPAHTASTTAGAADAGKLPRLSASGYLDSTFLTGISNDLKTYTAAEDIDGTVTPVAVCINTDGNVQKAEADETGIFDKFIGFVSTSVTAGTPSPFVNSSAGTSPTLSFTPGAGTNKVLIVNIGLYRNTPNVTFPSGVTFGGTPMVFVDSTNPDSAPGDTWGQVVYSLAISSSTATSDIVVTGAGYDNIAVQAACYSGVNQTTPTLIKAKATGTSIGPSVTLDATSNVCRIVNALMYAGSPTSVTWNDGQVQRESTVTGFGTDYPVSISDTTIRNGASKAFDATLGGSRLWGIQAIELMPTPPSNSVSVQVSGRIAYPSLTANAKYYLSNTTGAISTTPGSTSVLLGKALSTTELIIIQN